MLAEVQVAPQWCFAREAAATVIGDVELETLKHAHWEEVGHYRDIEIAPDFERYQQFEKNGILRLYTARAAGRLDGYGVFLLGTALNYRPVITAQQSTLFVHPRARRGNAGRSFIRWIEGELRAEGVQIVTQHVKAIHNAAHGGAFVRMLERDGYEVQDYVLTKRLDR